VNTKKYIPVESKASGKIKVLYAGLHGIAQGLDQIIAAANEIGDKEEIEFVFIGDGPEKEHLVNSAKKSKNTGICFRDPVAKSEIPSILAQADILIVPLKTQLTGAVPSKLYEGMAAAKPIILVAESEAAEIVLESDCGIVIKPGDIKSLISGIRYLASNPEARKRMGINGRKVAELRFDREMIADQFAAYLEENAK